MDPISDKWKPYEGTVLDYLSNFDSQGKEKFMERAREEKKKDPKG